ncbi:hypothetical protein X801_08234 [Opisthorchis viverrini]|uniref:Uncharacterized protein n=1 Tax=Opisthorchis viverrini TaxID=6198 RepID=A0A1S8WNC6_OPIVI|nr:hypothetical protein X801_08234 [Opisthorchis viverrini]
MAFSASFNWVYAYLPSHWPILACVLTIYLFGRLRIPSVVCSCKGTFCRVPVGPISWFVLGPNRSKKMWIVLSMLPCALVG